MFNQDDLIHKLVNDYYFALVSWSIHMSWFRRHPEPTELMSLSQSVVEVIKDYHE